jgi:hypothetical protein|tara:strand:+ start:2021 stop:2377 length:357 start_codon:yes stop_codon:yes gene_type:complete
MSVYKSTNHILANPYEKLPGNIDSNFYYPTTDQGWDYSKDFSIADVKMWQQLHYTPGGVGVYVSHVPRIEFYMITYNVFIDKEKGIETFYGDRAVEEVISKTAELGLEIPVNTNYISN